MANAVTNLADSPATLTGDPIVNEARKRFDRCAEYESNARVRFIDDIKFAHGDAANGYQWPNAIRRARDLDDKPCLTLNVVRQHNLQIVNDSKQNKTAMRIMAVGNGATVESAKMLQACIRHIEYQSEAQSVYATGSEFQVYGGIGWWRLITKYRDADSFDQEIYLERIKDPLSVYMDPDIKQMDGSDAKFALVFDNVLREEFDEAYPEYKGVIGNLQPMGVGASDSDWVTKDYVRVCEYFRVVETDDVLWSFVDPSDGQRKSLRESLMPDDILDACRNDRLAKWRPVKDQRVEWHLIVGDQIVDESEWAGKYIPLIRVVGEEISIDGILDRKGHTRAMLDAQRMYNYNAALGIDTRIPTPTGWTTMGQLQTGDWVFGQDGRPVQVKEALPIRYNEPCFKITFDGGHSVVTDAGHIWKVEERGKRKSFGFPWYEKTISTAELESKKHYITVAKQLALPEQNLPIDPYVLGLWLGDGVAASGRLCSHIDDAKEEKTHIADAGFDTGPISAQQGNGVVFTILGLRGKLAKAKLLQNKHVPAEYLRGSSAQRLALLQGLMDTDGHYASAINCCVFINTNKHIVAAVMELCASLGMKAYLSEQPTQMSIFPDRKERISQANFRVQFTPLPDMPVFRLQRKAVTQLVQRPRHWRRTGRIGIKSIERVDSVPVRCITLDTPNHLYLCTEAMIPTHNSSQVEFVALQGKTPWIAPSKAIEEMETYWNTANTQNHSVLPWNHVDDDGNPVPPPFKDRPPNASPAYEAGMTTAFNQMMMVSGQWQNQMGMGGNERTGEAIARRQAQGDTAVYHFFDNYESSIRYTARQLIDLIPRIYDTKRVLKCQAEDGEEFEVEIDPGAKQAYQQQIAENGQVVKRVFNPSIGIYDVQAGTGSAYGTKREETVKALTLILTQAPQLTGIIGDLLLDAMEFDKAQEAARRLKRMVPGQALGTGPSPNEQALQQQVVQLQAALAKSLERQGKDTLKLVGKDQMREIDAYKAETDRFKALSDVLQLDQGGIREVIEQLVQESLQTNLAPIFAANQKGIEDQAGDGDGDEKSGLTPDQIPALRPPMPGARKAPDGKWYLPDPRRPGKFLRVNAR